MIKGVLNEVTQQWENVMFLWATYEVLIGREKSIKLVLDLPINPLYPLRKFDNFYIADITTETLEKRFAYLPKLYNHSKISLLVRVRQGNYYYNYYSKENYPYYGYYDGSKWHWESISYDNKDLTFNANADGYNGQLYALKDSQNFNSYAIKGASQYYITALRIKPEIIIGGHTPELQFTVCDAIGEMIGKRDKGDIVKQYKGIFDKGQIVISKISTDKNVSGSGKYSTIKNPFYAGEVATSGITEVIE